VVNVPATSNHHSLPSRSVATMLTAAPVFGTFLLVATMVKPASERNASASLIAALPSSSAGVVEAGPDSSASATRRLAIST
jgi:hypothetical protein